MGRGWAPRLSVGRLASAQSLGMSGCVWGGEAPLVGWRERGAGGALWVGSSPFQRGPARKRRRTAPQRLPHPPLGEVTRLVLPAPPT